MHLLPFHLALAKPAEECGQERNRMLNYSYFLAISRLPNTNAKKRRKKTHDQKLQISLANEKSKETHINKFQCLQEVARRGMGSGEERKKLHSFVTIYLICTNSRPGPGWVSFGSIRLSLPSRLLFRVQCKNAFYSIFSSRNIDKLLAGIFDSIWGMPLLALSRSPSHT